jgi:hypothetical protein
VLDARNQHAPDPASFPTSHGDPLPGDPQVLQAVVDDFTFLRDVAWSVSQGLEAVVASASGGGFEGETADALRDAAAMVSQPIKIPSLWERIKGKVMLSLSIIGGILAFASVLIGDQGSLEPRSSRQVPLQ